MRIFIPGLVLAVAAVVPGQTATAATGGQVRVMDSVASGFATATCKPGDTLHGRGGEVTTGKSEPEIRLSSTAGSATAWANGLPSVTAYAICGPAAPVLSPTVELGASKDLSVQVSCPSGTSLYGADAEILPAGTGVVVTGIVPDAALRSVTVSADSSLAVANARWNISATAHCG